MTLRTQDNCRTTLRRTFKTCDFLGVFKEDFKGVFKRVFQQGGLDGTSNMEGDLLSSSGLIQFAAKI